MKYCLEARAASAGHLTKQRWRAICSQLSLVFLLVSVLAQTNNTARGVEADKKTASPEITDLPEAPPPAVVQLPAIEDAKIDSAKAVTPDKAPAPDDKPATKPCPTYPTVKITGFTQLDGGWYSQSQKNIDTVGDAQDGIGFRRARLAFNGKVAVNTAYQLEVDFATAGRPSFFDVYADQSELPLLGTIRLGQYCQPFSLDAVSGFRNLVFLERSLPFLAMVPFRRVGAMAFSGTDDERTHWAYGFYRTGGFNNAPLGDDRFAVDFGDLGGYGGTGRATHLFWFDEDKPGRHFWQLGASYSYAQLGANDAIGSGTAGNAGSPKPFYQARVTPEFGPLGFSENSSSFGNAANATPSFADTGRYQADSMHLVGVESLWQAGAASFQAEYIATVVNSVVGPIYYQGGYLQVAYRLTGEHREYDMQQSALRNPIPARDLITFRKPWAIDGWGAWEIAARWSIVDLQNPAKLDGHYYNSTTNTFNSTSKAGNGQLQDVTLGISWFLNQHFKLQANWIHAFLDNTAKGSSDADLFVTRAQVDF